MSDLVKARVLARQGAVLTLRLTLLPAEEGQLCTSREFAWMLVSPSSNEDEFSVLDPAALEACARAEEAIDEANMASPDRKRLQHCLVREVVVSDVENYTEERPRDRWAQAPDEEAEEALYPQATYRITFAEPALCAHLPLGFEWLSSAYDELDTNEFLPYP